MNIHAQISGLEQELATAEQSRREAQKHLVDGEVGPEKVRESREAEQLIRDRIEGLREKARIEAAQAVANDQRSDCDRREEAFAAANKIIADRLKLDRRQARRQQETAADYARGQSLDQQLLALARPLLPPETFRALKDALNFPLRDDEALVRELAAAGVPMPGISKAEAASLVQRHGFVSGAGIRNQRLLEAIQEIVASLPG